MWLDSPFGHATGPSIVAMIVALPVAVACASGDATADGISVSDSAGVVIVLHDLEVLSRRCEVGDDPLLSIGTAEGEEPYQLFGVFGATRLADGRIALVNQGSQSVRVFDARGRYLSSWGRAGEGPGEFRDAFYLWRLPGDTLLIGDYRPWQFEVFAPSGDWVRGVQPMPIYPNSPDEIGVLADGRAILGASESNYAVGRRFELEYLHLVLHAPDGRLLDTLGVYPNGRWGRLDDDRSSMTLFPLFESFMRVAVGGNRLAIGHGSEPSIDVYTFDPERRLTLIVRWATGDRTVTDRDVAAERERYLTRYADMDPQSRRRFLDPLISEDRPVADRFPAFRSLRFGTDDRLWVRAYPRPRDRDAQHWTAFDAPGEYVCEATLPEEFQVYEFGPDYVLGEVRDSLDVERVVLQELGPPHSPRAPAGR